MPKINKTGLFTFFEAQNVSNLDHRTKHDLIKLDGDFDQRLEAVIRDIEILLKNQPFVITLFAGKNQRGNRFYELIEYLKKFEIDYPTLWVDQSWKIPWYTIEKIKNKKYQKKIINYKKYHPKKIRKYLDKSSWFWSVMNEQSNISHEEWNYLKKNFEMQTKKDTIFPYVIPINENEQYTWLGLQRKFSNYNKKRKIYNSKKST